MYPITVFTCKHTSTGYSSKPLPNCRRALVSSHDRTGLHLLMVGELECVVGYVAAHDVVHGGAGQLEPSRTGFIV